MAGQRVECGAEGAKMDTENGNGNQASGRKVSRILLTLDRDNFLVTIAGETENFDEALAMLAMATREFEARIRAAQVKQVLTAPAGAAFPPLPRGRH